MPAAAIIRALWGGDAARWWGAVPLDDEPEVDAADGGTVRVRFAWHGPGPCHTGVPHSFVVRVPGRGWVVVRNRRPTFCVDRGPGAVAHGVWLIPTLRWQATPTYVRRVGYEWVTVAFAPLDAVRSPTDLLGMPHAFRLTPSSSAEQALAADRSPDRIDTSTAAPLGVWYVHAPLSAPRWADEPRHSDDEGVVEFDFWGPPTAYTPAIAPPATLGAAVVAGATPEVWRDPATGGLVGRWYLTAKTTAPQVEGLFAAAASSESKQEVVHYSVLALVVLVVVVVVMWWRHRSG